MSVSICFFIFAVGLFINAIDKMKTVTINVLPEIANFFEKADERDKSRVELYTNTRVNEIFGKQSANERLLDIMKESSAEAKRNGFKPEMLEEILKDDD